MKILTVNFLTCAVKSCKSSLSTTNTATRTGDQQQQQSGQDQPTSSAFPLHFRDAVLERTEIAFNPLFIRNILPRINWDALRTTATELGVLDLVPERNPIDNDDDGDKSRNEPSSLSGGDGVGSGGAAAIPMTKEREMDIEEGDGKMQVEADAAAGEDRDISVLRRLHSLLLETAISEGKLVCGKCGFEYPIKEGVANFLLPAHLV